MFNIKVINNKVNKIKIIQKNAQDKSDQNKNDHQIENVNKTLKMKMINI